ncbi:hypothetical protein RclHR1_03890021 [Rhizophagus clarus]|uniref:Uncharacterized protein n=1 Tax=Rhizophagus clarus TaxID=94130 RepID=A0A2Z6RD98_9GLOM|nr:hypothetical protein RclHR1_03890021 [Rhizophagus clarus]
MPKLYLFQHFQDEFLLEILARLYISKVQNTEYTGSDFILKVQNFNSKWTEVFEELHFKTDWVISKVRNSNSKWTEVFEGLKLHSETDYCLELHFEMDHCLEVLYRWTTISSEEVDRVISRVWNLKQTEVPISRRTRFAYFQRSSRGIRSHRLSRRLPDKF